MKNKVIHLSNVFSVKAAPESDEAIEIEGHASTPTEDRDGDIILASVWQKGIKEYLKNPVILAFHDHKNPVGEMVDYKADNTGLWIKARISKAADKVYGLVKDGIIKAFSVGFRVLDATYDPKTDLFAIKEVELIEISVVSVGSNRDALFSISKSFNDEEEFASYKMQFAEDSSAKGLDIPSAVDNRTNKEIDMTKEEMEKLLAETAAKAVAAALQKQAEEKEAAEKAAKEKAEKEAAEKAAKEAADKALEDKIKSTLSTMDVGASGAERLINDLKVQLEKQGMEQTKALDELNAALREKAEELAALHKSKMNFSAGTGEAVSYAEKEAAFLLGIVTGKGIAGTKYGKQLLEKVGAHVASATWELEVSRNMEDEVRRKLVVAQQLRSIPMQTNVMTIPVNPEAGVATWVTNAQFGTTNSTGAAQTHQLGEITLNAYKVATLEYLNYEEEEDSLLALMPTIRDAMIRRLARAIDIAFLRGAGTGGDPVKGLATYDAVSAVTHSIASGVVPISKLILLRKDLGAWGLDPSQLRYIVSTDVYFDLLDDTNFQTVDKIGDRATFLTGQVGAIGNTPVLVSAEFDAKGAGADGAICFAPGNFVVGNQRGLRFETDNLVETQRKVMVASMRTGLVQLTTNLGGAVSALEYAA